MFIDKNSIIINGISIGQYIAEAKYGYHKLWAEKDSGRNMRGDMTGTLLGIFPKITLQFNPISKSDLEILVPILDSARQTVTYYDPNKKQLVTMYTYTGDYEITNKNIIDNNILNEGFSCAFISTKRRV